ncbi:zinc-binding dehydrogenase [Filimonas effusa]|uniref:Alcohol dehydrogenase n=1 Tax=Filimonas effusa TaxID=2508721 RepID=A0A4V1M9P2_9BACT|nr:zinc-binding dehydrogenase [Filimonas effusa]RXK81900.1 alcohol dehydrogenase [Filimonas effusa]
MKAVVCPGKELPLQVQEVAMPAAGPGEVVVAIKAAAFNHRDWWIRQGQYANLRYPVVLGSDGSGIVYEVGEHVSIDWLGREVVMNPGMNWGDSPEYHSREFKMLGLPDDGCFARYVKVPASTLFPKPTYLSYEEAAAIPLAGLTGYRALFTKGNLKPGDHVLLTGIGGGVALLMLQMAVAIGAKVYVTSGDDAKIEKAQKLGASGGVNYKTEGWHKLLQAFTEGFDLIVDSAAGDGFRNFIDLARPGARIVFFGGTQGAITNLNPQKIFWKQLQIKGTTMGTPEEFEAMLQLFDRYHIHPVIDKVYSMEEADTAIHKMENASQFGKIIMRIE